VREESAIAGKKKEETGESKKKERRGSEKDTVVTWIPKNVQTKRGNGPQEEKKN